MIKNAQAFYAYRANDNPQSKLPSEVGSEFCVHGRVHRGKILLFDFNIMYVGTFHLVPLASYL